VPTARCRRTRRHPEGATSSNIDRPIPCRTAPDRSSSPIRALALAALGDRGSTLPWTGGRTCSPGRPPAHRAVTVAGDVVAHLYASTTAAMPTGWRSSSTSIPIPCRRGRCRGYELMVTGDIMRGPTEELGAKKPRAIPANAIQPFTGTCTSRRTRSRRPPHHGPGAEHLVPAVDRNPQTFVPNHLQGAAEDYKARVHRVYHTARYPSNVRSTSWS